MISLLTNIQGVSPLSPEEIATLRKQAWHQQHLLILSIDDPQLVQLERKVLIDIGNRIYGKGA